MAGSPHPSASPQSPRTRPAMSPDAEAPSNRSPDGGAASRRSKRALSDAFPPKSPTRGDSRDKGSLLCNASAASEDLPVGWKVHHTQGGRKNLCYVTPDGVTLGSMNEATQYLEKKPISRTEKKEILAVLDFSNSNSLTAKKISDNEKSRRSEPPRLKGGHASPRSRQGRRKRMTRRSERGRKGLGDRRKGRRRRRRRRAGGAGRGRRRRRGREPRRALTS